ncbi:hypothetical protein BBJ28_00000967 [Nothophytophthora sp. Chile5]|nr:hypothetical protein BBJ28_00000967 [Nothophytophthora sp. Chile5]
MRSASASVSSSPAPTTNGRGGGGARKTPSSAGSTASSSTRKQRVLWDSDSATTGGKTSISVLLEWLSTPNNYARWRDGKSQHGETREMLCSEIKAAMHRHGIRHRENANIRTQISELERSFEAARTWLEQGSYDPHTFEHKSGGEPSLAGGDIGRGPVEAHVLRLCRYYHVLNDIMGQTDGTPLRSRRPYNSANRKKRDRTKMESDDGEDEVDASANENIGAEAPRVLLVPSTAAAQTPMGVPAAAPAAVTGGIPSAAMLGAWPNSATLANYESTQRMLAEAVREERERKRFGMEEERHNLECEKLRCQVDAAKLQLTLDRALARKKLLDAGLLESQVDALFPR